MESGDLETIRQNHTWLLRVGRARPGGRVGRRAARNLICLRPRCDAGCLLARFGALCGSREGVGWGRGEGARTWVTRNLYFSAAGGTEKSGDADNFHRSLFRPSPRGVFICLYLCLYLFFHYEWKNIRVSMRETLICETWGKFSIGNHVFLKKKKGTRTIVKT